MTELAPSQTAGFTVTRTFAAPREVVWAAWTDPAQLASWFGPRGLTAPRESIALDLRPGGIWRITMVADTDGAEYPQTFSFSEVTEPERLVFSTTAVGGVHNTGAVITLTLLERVNGTEMTLTVEGISDDDSTSGLEQGWASSFDCLAELVDGAPA